MRKLIASGLCMAASVMASGLLLSRQALAQGGTIQLQDAVSTNRVTVSLSGTGALFFQEAIAYEISSTTSSELTIVIPAGLLLIPEDSEHQTMIVGRAVTITIRGGRAATGNLWVFCAEAGDSAPAADSAYSVGQMAAGHLLRVAQVISAHGWQGELGSQLAVWRVTDEMTQDSLTGDSGQAAELIRAIQPLLGLAGDPFARADAILQEAGTGLYFCKGGPCQPAESPLPGNVNLGDIIRLLQQFAGCCSCLGGLGGVFGLALLRR